MPSLGDTRLRKSTSDKALLKTGSADGSLFFRANDLSRVMHHNLLLVTANYES
jgi:hypothetical protein